MDSQMDMDIGMGMDMDMDCDDDADRNRAVNRAVTMNSPPLTMHLLPPARATARGGAAGAKRAKSAKSAKSATSDAPGSSDVEGDDMTVDTAPSGSVGDGDADTDLDGGGHERGWGWGGAGPRTAAGAGRGELFVWRAPVADWTSPRVVAAVLEFLLGTTVATHHSGGGGGGRHGPRRTADPAALDAEATSYRLVSKAWALCSYRLLARHLSRTATCPEMGQDAWAAFLRRNPRGALLSQGAVKNVYCVGPGPRAPGSDALVVLGAAGRGGAAQEVGVLRALCCLPIAVSSASACPCGPPLTVPCRAPLSPTALPRLSPSPLSPSLVPCPSLVVATRGIAAQVEVALSCSALLSLRICPNVVQVRLWPAWKCTRKGAPYRPVSIS